MKFLSVLAGQSLWTWQLFYKLFIKHQCSANSSGVICVTNVYPQIRLWSVSSAAYRLALAGRSGTYAVQARCNSAPVSATQGPAVPDVLCYVSLEHHQQTATTLCQSSPTSCAALPTQLTWSSVLRCQWTKDLEFAVS